MRSTFGGRIPAALRDKDPDALSKDAICVPDSAMRDLPPTGSYRLASHYLLGEGRLKRRETTVDIYLSEVGSRTIDVECSLPNYGWGKKLWYLPLAFFPKNEVAPDLEVTDGSGEIVPIPTKQQNLALTKRAVDELIVEGKLEVPLERLRDFVEGGKNANWEITLEDVRRFLSEIIVDNSVDARARRLHLEKAIPSSLELISLMRQLEDNFVLWVPAEGEPMSERQFRICRQEIRPQDQIISNYRFPVVREIHTALGTLWVRGLSSAGVPWLRFKALLDRLPITLAVRPMEASVYDLEAKRASSSHTRVNAPPGLLVRNVRVGEMFPSSETGHPQIEPIDLEDEGVVIQGWDQNLGHFHLFRKHNPEQVYCRVTLAPRAGVLSLWVLTTVLTATLLWLVHHHYKQGGLAHHHAKHLHQHFELVASLVKGGRGDDLQLALGGNEKQIAAAALLVGPTFASAWSLRAEGGELLRSLLWGARLLLLSSAALSVLAALALAGLMPLNIDDYTAIEIYAALSYLVATPMIGAWLLSWDSLWIFFRFVLRTSTANLLAILLLGWIVVAAGYSEGLPDGGAGVIIALCGLGLALIGANSAGQPLRLDRKGSFYRSVAAIGAIFIITPAGAFLGFYGHLLSVQYARVWCVVVGLGAMAAAMYGMFKKY